MQPYVPLRVYSSESVPSKRLSVPALPAVLVRAGEERLGEGARYGL